MCLIGENHIKLVVNWLIKITEFSDITNGRDPVLIDSDYSETIAIMVVSLILETDRSSKQSSFV